MEKNHPHPQQHPCDFFYVFSEPNQQEPFQQQNINHTGQLEESSSIPSLGVSTELSLSSSTLCSQPKTHHQCLPGSSKRNNSSRNRKPAKPNSNPSSSASSSSRNTKSFNSNKGEWGYSTALKLYDDPWKIKKVLTASDLGKLNRLLLGSDSMENLVVPVLAGNNNNNDDELSLMAGRAVRVWDVDTMSMHELVLKRWASFKNYVLIGDWNQDFVKRRDLKKGDEIGLHWDSYNHCFNFSVLKRA